MKKKRVLTLLLALMMLLLGINYAESKEVDAAEIKSGVKVTKVTVTKSRVDVKVKISSDGKKNVSYGEHYFIERYENGKWQKLTMKENVGFNDIAYEHSTGGAWNDYKTYCLAFPYKRSELTPGKYRICIDINFKKADRYATFTIPEFKQTDFTENTRLNVKKGTVVQLKVNSKKKVEWTSGNEKIATVNKKGIVTTKKAGKVKIKAKVGKKVLKCTIQVTKK